MRLQRGHRVELAASRDRYREHICRPWLDAESKRMYATNGHILATVPAEVADGDRSGVVPAEACVAARAPVTRRQDKHAVTARRDLVVTEKALYRRPRVKTPDVAAVLPKVKPGDKGTVTICIDPKLLATLCLALGTPNSALMTITVGADGVAASLDAVLVQGGTDGDDRPVGALMPRRWGP